MPKSAKYEPRKQRCFCEGCNGAYLPWSTWSRHRKALAQQVAALAHEARHDEETAALATSAPEPTLDEEFKRTKSKKEERAAQVRARLLGINKSLDRLGSQCRGLPHHVTFLTTPTPTIDIDASCPEAEGAYTTPSEDS